MAWLNQAPRTWPCAGPSFRPSIIPSDLALAPWITGQFASGRSSTVWRTEWTKYNTWFPRPTATILLEALIPQGQSRCRL
jgi:hypothetical protein